MFYPDLEYGYIEGEVHKPNYEPLRMPEEMLSGAYKPTPEAFPSDYDGTPMEYYGSVKHQQYNSLLGAIGWKPGDMVGGLIAQQQKTMMIAIFGIAGLITLAIVGVIVVKAISKP